MKTITTILLLTAALTARAQSPATTNLFNGKDLAGWQIADMYKPGAVTVLPGGEIQCDPGTPMTGIAYTNPVPTMNYELSLEATRVDGEDFFIALTIPVETNHCTIIIGGWGGSLCGISCIDYADAAENPHSESRRLENRTWYTLRVRLTPGVLQVFLNENYYTARVEFDSSARFSLRPGSDIDLTLPLGLATYRTRARWRNFTLTPITTLLPADKPRPDEY